MPEKEKEVPSDEASESKRENDAAQGEVHVPEPSPSTAARSENDQAPDVESEPLRTKSKEDSADAAAKGHVYNSALKDDSSSTAPSKKPTQQPGAYRVMGSPLIKRRKKSALKKGEEEAEEDRETTEEQRPGAYAVPESQSNTPAHRLKRNEDGYVGYAPVTTAPAKAGTDAANAAKEENTPKMTKVGTATSEKKTKKKLMKPGVYKVAGVGSSAKKHKNSDDATDDKTTASKNQKSLQSGYTGYAPVTPNRPEGKTLPDNNVRPVGRSPSFTDDTTAQNDGYDDEELQQSLSTRERVHGGEVLPEAADVDVHAKWSLGEAFKSKKKRYIILAIVVCIIGIAVGVGVALSSSSSGGNNDDDKNTQKGGTTPPPAATSAPVPTVDLDPCYNGDVSSYAQSDRIDTIRKSLLDNKISNETKLDTPNSSQRQALCWVSFANSEQYSTNEKHFTQRYILGVMFKELGKKVGGKFSLLDWLDASKSECDWERVECDATEEGTVTGLALTGHSLEGKLPDEIAGLLGLRVLKLGSNSMTGTIPEQFGNLGSLTELILGGSTLHGTLPTSLGQLTNLEIMDVDGSDLVGTVPSEYGKLTNLVEFLAEMNDLEGNIGHVVDKWPNLERLYLTANNFNGTILDSLTSASSLIEVVLDFNDFSGTLPPELGEITAIGRISVTRNKMHGPLPPEYGNLFQLETLELENNNFNSTLPTEYGKLERLDILEIHRNDMTGDVLASHPVCNLILERFRADGICECCKWEGQDNN